MTIASYSKLQRYWSGWETKLKPLVNGRNGAKLFFPDALQHSDIIDGRIMVRPTEPIFIHNAPSKASSTRGKAARLAIFIAGSFEVSVNEGVYQILCKRVFV
jgi:hypothetical protein